MTPEELKQWVSDIEELQTDKLLARIDQALRNAQAAEREACAKIAEQHNDNGGGEIETVTKLIAKEIRARAT